MAGSVRHKLLYLQARVYALLQRLRRVPPLEKRVLEAFFSYHPPSYSGRVLLLETELSPAHCDIASTWEGILTGPVEIKTVPGNHVSALLEPHISSVAQRIGETLQKVQLEDAPLTRSAVG